MYFIERRPFDTTSNLKPPKGAICQETVEENSEAWTC